MKKEVFGMLLIASLFLFCSSCTTGDMPDKGIVVLSPKANDVMPAGGSYEIQWKVEVSDENSFGVMMTVEFSPDGGKSWEKVEENINKNDGKYAWKVPKIDRPQCKVRVFSQRSVEFRGTSGVFAVK
jgi:hypothetical protein